MTRPRHVKALVRNKQLWSLLVLLLFVVLVAGYVATHWEEFTRLELTRPILLPVLAFMVLVNLYGTGRSMDSVLHPLGVRLAPFETFGLVSITRLSNQVAPGRLGLGVRATYLKRKWGLPLTQFVSSLAAVQIVTYFLSSALGVIAITILWQQAGVPALIPFFLLLAGVLVVLLLLLLFSPHVQEREHKIFNYFAKAINGWNTIRRDRHALALAGFWVVITITSQVFIIFTVFNSFGADIGVVEAAFITSINIFSVVIGITPAGLGISEGLIVGAATAIGLPVSLALSAALLRRIVMFVAVLVSTLLSCRYLFGKPLLEVWRDQKRRPS